jgi:hypothetical protein
MAARYVPKTAADNDATFGGMPLGVVEMTIDSVENGDFVDASGVTRDGSVGFDALAKTSTFYRDLLTRRADRVYEKFIAEHTKAYRASKTAPQTINMYLYPEVYLRFMSDWFIQYVMIPRINTTWGNPPRRLDTSVISKFMQGTKWNRSLYDFVRTTLDSDLARRRLAVDILRTTLRCTGVGANRRRWGASMIMEPEDFFVGIDMSPTGFIKRVGTDEAGLHLTWGVRRIPLSPGWWYKSDEWTCADVMRVTEFVVKYHDMDNWERDVMFIELGLNYVATNYYSYLLFPGMTIRAIKAFLAAGCDKDYVAIRDNDTSYTRVMREMINS